MSARTSTSHPLRIDTIDLPPGRLGLTFCPGKKQCDALTGQWDRDLALDLQAIQQWGAAAVVTAMEPHELDQLQVPHLGRQIEELGIDWHPLTIVDAGIPDHQHEAYWHYVGSKLRSQLAAGEGVVIHCKGGLGRTGTLAACLLVELGLQPSAAVDQVRSVRHGAIETSAQLDYVLQRTPSSPNVELPDWQERVLGCLLGGAVGDAFGYAIEFDRLDAILDRYGSAGLQEPEYEDGRLVVSDDTQMTMFTLEAVLKHRRGEAAEDLVTTIWQAYLDWLKTQDRHIEKKTAQRDGLVSEPVMHARRAPGNTCLDALRSGQMGTPAKRLNDSKGCGGVMRVAPLGLLPWLSAREAFDAAVDAAAITHSHPSGYLSAGTMAAMLRVLVEGESLRVAVDTALDLLNEQRDGAETAQAIRAVQELLHADEPVMELVPRLGEGWVGEEALAIGLLAAQRGCDFREVIQIAANHSGDSDSTASIAAQLYGAAHGLAGLPNAWVRRLDVLQPLLRLCRELSPAPH